MNYQIIADKRKKALILSLEQTREEIKRKMIKKNPNEPEWFIRALCDLVWFSTRSK